MPSSKKSNCPSSSRSNVLMCGSPATSQTPTAPVPAGLGGSVVVVVVGAGVVVVVGAGVVVVVGASVVVVVGASVVVVVGATVVVASAMVGSGRGATLASPILGAQPNLPGF